MVFLGLYFLIGMLLGWAWNRVEFARFGLGGTLASFASFVVAWPLIALSTIAVAAIWSHEFDDTGRNDELVPDTPEAAAEAAARPAPPALTGRAAAH